MTKIRRVPSLTLHKGSGQARVRIRGKDYYLGVYGTPESHARYAELLKEMQLDQQIAASARAQKSLNNSLSDALAKLPVSMIEATINDVILKFVKHSENYFVESDGTGSGTGKPNKDCKHFRSVLKILRARFGRLPISNLTGPHLKQVQQDMVEKGWSRTYCNSQLGKLKYFLKWAVSEDLCPVEVLQKAQTVEGLRQGKTTAHEVPDVVPVADEIVLNTLPYLTETVADLIRIIRLTGARPKEIRLLQVQHISEIEDGLLEVNLDKHKNSWRGQLREITFGPEASRILRKYLQREPESYLFSPRRAAMQRYERMRQSRKTRVQPSQKNRKKRKPQRSPGEFYSADSLRRAIVYACEQAFGMPKELKRISRKLPKEEQQRRRELANQWRQQHCWTPYQLRHTALTEARERFGLETAQAVGGHARMNMTEHYAAVHRKLRRQAMKEVG